MFFQLKFSHIYGLCSIIERCYLFPRIFFCAKRSYNVASSIYKRASKCQIAVIKHFYVKYTIHCRGALSKFSGSFGSRLHSSLFDKDESLLFNALYLKVM